MSIFGPSPQEDDCWVLRIHKDRITITSAGSNQMAIFESDKISKIDEDHVSWALSEVLRKWGPVLSRVDSDGRWYHVRIHSNVSWAINNIKRMSGSSGFAQHNFRSSGMFMANYKILISTTKVEDSRDRQSCELHSSTDLMLAQHLGIRCLETNCFSWRERPKAPESSHQHLHSRSI